MKKQLTSLPCESIPINSSFPLPVQCRQVGAHPSLTTLDYVEKREIRITSSPASSSGVPFLLPSHDPGCKLLSLQLSIVVLVWSALRNSRNRTSAQPAPRFLEARGCEGSRAEIFRKTRGCSEQPHSKATAPQGTPGGVPIHCLVIWASFAFAVPKQHHFIATGGKHVLCSGSVQRTWRRRVLCPRPSRLFFPHCRRIV